METMEWPQYLQFKQETFPQWTFTLRIVNDQRVTEIEMEDRYHAIHHPYATFEYLKGLKIGQELLAARSSAADDLLKVLLHPRAVPKEIDDAIGKYVSRMADSSDRYGRFLARYELADGVPVVPMLRDRKGALSMQLKRAKGKTRKQIERAIEGICELFLDGNEASEEIHARYARMISEPASTAFFLGCNCYNCSKIREENYGDLV